MAFSTVEKIGKRPMNECTHARGERFYLFSYPHHSVIAWYDHFYRAATYFFFFPIILQRKESGSPRTEFLRANFGW